ncbi:hypothetical protein CMO92_01610 [Candidatus Woesearchaeota archaeon]|nr:hypothetical protein [Candidatus Woesearchaeota archaeon]
MRNNSRTTLKELSKQTEIPISTLFDKLKQFPYIKRFTCLLDYKQLGYDLRVLLLLKAPSFKKAELEEYLQSRPRLNTLVEVSNGWDYFVELYFKNIQEYHAFLKSLRLQTKSYHEIFVLNELKEEAFLSKEPKNQNQAQSEA